MSAKYNITCNRGTTFTFQFKISNDSTAWDLTGYTATMTVKPFIDSTTTILSATTDNGLIVLDATNGRATVTVPSTTTASFPAGRHVYDFIFTSGSTVTKVLEGKFVVVPGVSV